VDAVVYSAATYTGHSSGDTQQQDFLAFTNVVNAAKSKGVGRVVLASITASHLATDVPHFYDKYRMEQLLTKEGVPFVAVRAPTFIDQDPKWDFNVSSLPENYIPAMFDPAVKYAMVLADDYARALGIAAVDIPRADIPLTVHIGSTPNLSNNELAEVFSEVLGRKIVTKPPVPGVGVLLRVAGVFSHFVADLAAMFRFFGSGKYIHTAADIAQSEKYFGTHRTIKSAVEEYVKQLKASGKNLDPRPPSYTSKVVLAAAVACISFGVYHFYLK
jgi:uncharacterized protein YbjT (DUF2867 family)